MIRATPRAVLLLLAGALPACGEAAPPPAATPAGPAAVPDDARHAADVAIEAAGKRKYNTARCVPGEARVVASVETSPPAPAEGCTVLVARRPDGMWLVVLHSTAQLGGVSAWVTVSAGGEGVKHVEYKP
jgi:hypothetical protein